MPINKKATSKKVAKDASKDASKEIIHSLEEDGSLSVKPKKKIMVAPNNLPANLEVYIPGSSQTMDTEKKSEENTGDDFYSTWSKDISALLSDERFKGGIWEPACWTGAISETLQVYYWDENVYSSDLIDRGFWHTGIDFLQTTTMPANCMNIITNPPPSLTKEFINQWISLLPEWWKLALLLKSTYRFGVLFPKTQYTFKNPVRFKTSTGNTKAMDFSWFIWEKWTEYYNTSSRQLWPKTAKYFRDSFTS